MVAVGGASGTGGIRYFIAIRKYCSHRYISSRKIALYRVKYIASIAVGIGIENAKNSTVIDCHIEDPGLFGKEEEAKS